MSKDRISMKSSLNLKICKHSLASITMVVKIESKKLNIRINRADVNNGEIKWYQDEGCLVDKVAFLKKKIHLNFSFSNNNRRTDFEFTQLHWIWSICFQWCFLILHRFSFLHETLLMNCYLLHWLIQEMCCHDRLS